MIIYIISFPTSLVCGVRWWLNNRFWSALVQVIAVTMVITLIVASYTLDQVSGLA